MDINKNDTNINNNNLNNYFDIFDTENKFKNIYLEDENSNKNINLEEDINNCINNDRKNSEGSSSLDNENILNIINDAINNKNINNNINNNNNFNNFNLNNQFINLNNKQNFINNNFGLSNKIYIHNSYNNNKNILNLNNINNYSYNNTNSFGINNLQNNYFPTKFNNSFPQVNNKSFINISNSDMNKQESYVNNLNNMIYRYNAQNAAKYNLINNISINKNNIYNIIPINYNINNYQRNNIYLTPQNQINYYPFYNIVNNNISSYTNNNIKNNNNSNKFDIKQNESKDYNKEIKSKNELINKEEESNQELNQLNIFEKPEEFLQKNMNQKKWVVFEKDKGNYIRHFNTKELYEYLKEKEGQESFNNLTINDLDTDYFFPTQEIFDNLKNFYST